MLKSNIYAKIKLSFLSIFTIPARECKEKEMEKREWLLLSIREGIQPIQLQKLLFKFAKEADAPQQELYDFEPYNWGPCSFEIYDDLGTLRLEDLVESVPSGRGWNAYRLTDKGKGVEQELRQKADDKLQGRLDEKYRYVTSRTFDELLKDVYKDYPDFATKSLFND